MRRPGWAVLLTLVSGAVAAGCLGGGKPPPEYFTLSAPAGASAEPALAARPELGLAIGPLELPRYVDRPELVTRGGPHRLRVWSERRWSGSLRTDVLRVIGDELARLLGTSRIVLHPTEPRFPLDYRVVIELLELGGVPAQAVTLRARWTIAGGGDGRAVAIGESHAQQTLASPSWDDFVAAHAAVVMGMSREIAERIASLPSR